MGVQYAALSRSSLIRDFRKNGQSENHLFKLLHRGYTGLINSREGDHRPRRLPLRSFYSGVDQGPRRRCARSVESFTRETVGTDEAPIDGIPNRLTAVHR